MSDTPATPDCRPRCEVQDAAYAALADCHRRRLLVALWERRRLHVENDYVPEEVADGQTDVESLRIAMYHRHLPRLAAAGFVEWREGESVIERGPNFDAVAPLLDRDDLADLR